MVSARGGRHGFVYPAQQDVYRALRRKGYAKAKAARIANSKARGGKRKAKRGKSRRRR